MNRFEKCQHLKKMGYIYDPNSGKIYGRFGKEITGRNNENYILINLRIFKGVLLAHHYAWFWVYGNVDFEELDHINRIKDDNRISNLRISNRTEQSQNRESKGYSWHKRTKKWVSKIVVNKKVLYLGYFNTEEEARKVYLEAKKKYHII